jgi:hypothetical protein
MLFFSSSIMPSVARAQRSVRLGLEVPERQLLQLVLDLAHAKAVGDRRVDVARLLGDLDAPLLGQVEQRTHVVQAVGELDEDDPDVVDHRQQHLAEVLRLPLLVRRERDRPQLGHPFDHVRHVGPEQFRNPLDRRLRVLDDVVQEPCGNGDDVQLHLGEQIGHLEGVDEVGLPGMADLSLVLEGGKHVRPAQELDIGVRIGRPDLFHQILEPEHGQWCLNGENEDCSG